MDSMTDMMGTGLEEIKDKVFFIGSTYYNIILPFEARRLSLRLHKSYSCVSGIISNLT